MISLFMQGGPSHVDLFDPKPKLTELDGKPFPGQIKYDNAAQASSRVLGSPWKFANTASRHRAVGAAAAPRRGGGRHHRGPVDDQRLNNHVQASTTLNTGRILSGNRCSAAGCVTASVRNRRIYPPSSPCPIR